jgi:BirA family transcriptional regulator, biotin operon repressor / biotin---[acetyl-CoA-carboxylase] ligase
VPSPFRDLDRPPLRERALRAALVVDGGMWTRLDVVAETGSTNADVAAAAAAGAPEGLVRVAEHQVAGRGRLDRTWVAPDRSALTFSVLLRPPPATRASWGWLPLLAGLSVATTITRLGEVEARLKWPNDVLLGARQRKAAGILAEVGDGGAAVVVGIGVNVAAAPEDESAATCLAAEGAPAVDRTAVLVTLLARLAERESAWRAAGGDPDAARLRADYRGCCVSLGSEVRVELPGGAALHGIAEDVDVDGRLLLVDPAGRRRAVAAGDVVHLRPAG